MSKATDIQILEVHCAFEPINYRTPLKFGGRTVEKTELVNIEVKVESRSGRHATGLGSMPLGNVWAWPSESVTPEQSASAMKQFAKDTAELAAFYNDYDHPLDIMYRISAEYTHLGQKISKRLNLPETMPVLAELVAASALDAAVHDAFGRVHGLNSYNALSREFVNFDLSEYLDDSFRGEYLDQYTLRQPKERMPLYHLVGALDPLTSQDIAQRIGDRLPETLGEWIAADGITYLKVKLAGDNLKGDIERFLAVDRVATEAQGKRNCSQWQYSLDFNEKCANVQYVLDFLSKVREKARARPTIVFNTSNSRRTAT